MDRNPNAEVDVKDVFTSIKQCDLRRVGGFLLGGGDPSMLYLPDGISCMHLAAGAKGLRADEIIKLLLIYGGNPNVRSFEGLTPVHISAAWGRHRALKLLLKYGGDPCVRDDDGLDAWDFARSNNHRKATMVLQEMRMPTHPHQAPRHQARGVHEDERPKCKPDKDLVNRLTQKQLQENDVDESLRTELYTVSWDGDRKDKVNVSKRCATGKATLSDELRHSDGDLSWYTVDECLYLNDEKHVALVEQHWIPTEPSDCGSESSFLTADTRAVWCVDGRRSVQSVSGSILELDDRELMNQLRSHNETPGPITPSTRRVYLRRLFKLRQRIPGQVTTTKDKTILYSAQLMDLMNGKQTINSWSSQEEKFLSEFSSANVNRGLRGGLNRSHFNYLLLDPRTSLNLPLRASNMTTPECLAVFVKSIFYVGKGKNARSYDHFSDASKSLKFPSYKKTEKILRILDIWNDGFGVVSLHCFHGSMSSEAFTREACIIEALKMENLTNLKRGEFYGQVRSWTCKDKCKLGSIFLQRAMHIFLQEGEKQIRPFNI